MSKTYEELAEACNALIPRDVIEQRDGGAGKKLSYLPGFYVINRLNEVFGQGLWSYASEVTLLHQGQLETRSGPTNSVHYMAKVRLVVDIAGKMTEFSDYGYGDGTDKTNPGKAHELAIKEAVTDGLKRAARCLGNSFGNGLYDKSGEGIEDDKPAAKASAPVPAPVSNSSGKKEGPIQGRELTNKQISQYAKVALDKKVLTQEQLLAMLKTYNVSKKEELNDAQAAEVLAKLKETVNG